MENQFENIPIGNKRVVERNIDALAWGLFFVWVGIAFLIPVSNGVGLLGVGIITLGAQLFRYYYQLNLEGFWIVVGVAFVLGGLWEFLDADIALVPILLIVAGIALFYSVWKKNNSRKK